MNLGSNKKELIVVSKQFMLDLILRQFRSSPVNKIILREQDTCSCKSGSFKFTDGLRMLITCCPDPHQKTRHI